MASPRGFSYRAGADGRVMLAFHGRRIMTLAGDAASEFLEEAEAADDESLQHLMANVTGQFKHGNERLAKDHPRNQYAARR